jgi:uncharacterized DUF497 family protein
LRGVVIAKSEATKQTDEALKRYFTYNVCMIEFEWDPSKASLNLKKHGVAFDEAKTVFFDEFAVQFFDEPHSTTEDRFLMLGLSSLSRILIVCHCEPGDAGVIRIISARKATKTEKSFYQGDLNES